MKRSDVTVDIKTRPAPSVHIKEVGYSDTLKTMRIVYTDRTVDYKEVPRIVYDEFINALNRGLIILARVADNYKQITVEENK